MKKTLIALTTIASLLIPVGAYAAFNSQQLAPSPSSGNCLKTDGSNNSWSATCGGGSGGGSGGTWATTTSSVPNHLINYSLNNTDIITIGNSSTSTAKFIFDPNSQIGYFSSLVGINTKSPNFTLEVNGEASSSKLSGAGLATCNSNTFLTWASSLFGCAADIQFSTTSATYWLTLNRGAAYSTTSADYWLTQKTTDNLTQGSTNKYDQTVAFTNGTGISVTGTYPNFTVTNTAPNAFSTTSTDYWLTQNRGNAFSTTSADAYINASSTIAHPAGGATGNVIQWDGTKFVSVATSTLGLGGSGGGSVTSVSGSGGTTGLTLTGGPITTAGTLTLGGTLAVANGGTNASSFTTSGNSVYYNGTSLLTAPLTSAVTTPYASTTALSATTLCLTGDTCLTAWPTGGGAAYPFALSGNATSTKTQFNGGLTAYASSTIGDGTQTGGLTVSGTASSTRFLASAGTTALPAYGFLNNIGTGFSDGGAPNSTIEVNLDGTEYYRFAHAGLGIGTTSPYAPLSVVGTVVAANYVATTTATSTFAGPISIGSSADINSPTIYGIATNAWSAGYQVSNKAFVIASSSVSDPSAAFPNPVFTILKGGNTGIGTTSPYALLSVSGRGVFDQDIRANYFTATSTSIASTLPYASTTAMSAQTICLTGDTCRTTWPTGGGGGGTSYFASTTSNVGIYPSGGVNTAVVIGRIATTTNSLLEVNGTTTVNNLVSTSTTATSTFAGPVTIGSATASTTFAVDVSGHIMTGGNVPTCGANCTSIIGDDNTMRVVTGSSVSSATVNFATTWKNSRGTSITPACVAVEESGGTVAVDASSTPSTVVLEFASALTSINIAVHCQASDNFLF